MSSMEDIIQAACRDRDIPGAVLVATDKTGKFQYHNSFGVRSLEDGHHSPLRQDAIMSIASCTKLLTAIAVLQCVERGLLHLDEDVVRVLPEFKDIEVITGADESTGELKIQKATKVMTLRLLLTHSSGLAYDAVHPYLLKWRESRGEKPSPGLTVETRFLYPLVFEPGTSWNYGVGTDWAGKMVERVNSGMTLETYFEKYIWQPLGIKDMAFFVKGKHDLEARKAGMHIRKEPHEKAMYFSGSAPFDGVTDCMGGQGLNASAPEYLKVLHSLLTDNEKLLKKESLVELFTSQLTEMSQKALMKLLEDEETNNILGAGLSIDSRKSWGLGGLLCLDDVPGWRQKGTMTWTGLPNLGWFIDHKAGLCGLYASQIMPPGDPKSIKLQQAFEQAMYERSKAVMAHI